MLQISGGLTATTVPTSTAYTTAANAKYHNAHRRCGNNAVDNDFPTASISPKSLNVRSSAASSLNPCCL